MYEMQLLLPDAAEVRVIKIGLREIVEHPETATQEEIDIAWGLLVKIATEQARKRNRGGR